MLELELVRGCLRLPAPAVRFLGGTARGFPCYLLPLHQRCAQRGEDESSESDSALPAPFRRRLLVPAGPRGEGGRRGRALRLLALHLFCFGLELLQTSVGSGSTG